MSTSQQAMLAGPAAYSPLATDGKSLQTRQVSASSGVMSNIDEYLRPTNTASVMTNFHQFTPGVFSSGGGGWKRDNVSGLNSNAAILDFGIYLDALSNQYLMVQAGSILYNYVPNTSGGGGGTGTSLATGLNSTALPCMRLNSPTSYTSNPFTIYCNGKQEPLKIYNATAGSAPNVTTTLGFNNGFSTEIAYVTGTLIPGQSLNIIVSGSGVTSSNPLTISYTIQAGDTYNTAAAALAAAVNNSVAAAAAGMTATSSGGSIAIKYPSALTSLVWSANLKYETATIGGSLTIGDQLKITASLPNSTETATVGGSIAAGNVFTITITSANLPNGSLTISYTAIAGDTTTTVAAALVGQINANAILSQNSYSASNVSAVVTIQFPTTPAPGFSATASGSATLVMAAGVTGTTVTVIYTTISGDTTSTMAAGLAAAINSNLNLNYAGIKASAASAVITISYPSVLSPAFSQTVTGSATETISLANTTPSITSSITFGQSNNSPTWPGTFNSLTYTKPKFCEPFLGRTAYCGFANTGPSGNSVCQAVLISSLNNAELFTQSTPTQATDAWVINIPSKLGAPTGMRHFRPLTNTASEILVIGCQNGMCIIEGTDATTFNLQIQSDEFGVPSNRTWIQLDNNLLFLATDGIRAYNGTNNISNLLTDSLTLGIFDQFEMIDQTNWAVSHAVHHRYTQEVWFWVPYTGEDGNPAHGDAGQPQHAFVYQYNTVSGSPIWYFVDNTVCMASIEFNNTFYGGHNDGLIQAWYGVNNYDDANSALGSPQNITPGATLTLALVGPSNPSQFCSIQTVVVGTGSALGAGGNQKCLINAATYEAMDDGSTRKQQQAPLNWLLQSFTPGQTVLGPASPEEWILNTSAFPANYSKFLGGYVPEGHGRVWEFTLSCNDTSHNLDFTFLQATISIGGQRV